MSERPKKMKKKRGGSSFELPDLGGIDGEGIVILVGLIVALALGWVLVELLAPALMVVAYALILFALRRVANDRHGCEGSLPRSILWGAIWATVYTLPIAGAVLLVRWISG